MLVVDTSAVLAALAGGAPPTLLARLAEDSDLHAPHLLDTEILHALRRLVRTGAITEDKAADIRSDVADLAIVRYPHEPLSDRVWELRTNLTAYDATFIALAEAFAVPLVTCDGALARAPGHNAVVELHTHR
ncbi:MAG: type II toxin-antitoxin system VapC family toxin [Baekduiaceae bacterium]